MYGLLFSEDEILSLSIMTDYFYFNATLKSFIKYN